MKLFEEKRSKTLELVWAFDPEDALLATALIIDDCE